MLMPLPAQHERERTLDGAAIDHCIAQAVAARATADECQPPRRLGADMRKRPNV
jgi:hypothetical protein